MKESVKKWACRAVAVFGIMLVVIGMVFILPGLFIAIASKHGWKKSWAELDRFLEELAS